MRRLVAWIGELGRWLFWEGRLAWCIGLSVAGALVALRLWPDEAVIRRVGLGFELAGIGTVLWGVKQTREHFGLSGLREAVGRWIGNRPRFKRRVVVEGLSGTISAAGTVGAYVRGKPGQERLGRKTEAAEADLPVGLEPAKFAHYRLRLASFSHRGRVKPHQGF